MAAAAHSHSPLSRGNKSKEDEEEEAGRLKGSSAQGGYNSDSLEWDVLEIQKKKRRGGRLELWRK